MKITGLILYKPLMILFLVLALTLPVSAQDTGGEPAAILVYADDEFELEVFDADNMAVEAYIGMELLEGDSIRTNNSTVELQLEPNGSILKLSESTALKVEGFQRDINSSNDFALLGGKLRAVAARTAKSTENYNIFTQTAVCGVRGTDFLIDAAGILMVAEGAVEFIKNSTGESLRVSAGMTADILADTFETLAMSAEQITQAFQEFQFQAISPSSVPGHSTAETVSAEEPLEKDPQEEEADESDDDIDADTPVVTETEPDSPQITEGPREPSAFEEFLAPIGNFLGMEIGSFTVDDKTYSKLLLQPEFAIGKLQVALYLPFIYETNLFNSSDWYHPGGNNEWSFGRDKDDIDDKIYDAVDDLFLKIRYIKWGEQRDPFYFKFGNLNDMTLGHGILMMDYANDADFPAIRKVGFNLGLNGDGSTLELVADDLANPQVFGARYGFSPFGTFPLAFGFSGVTDINPDKDLTIDYGDPMFINPAFDAEMPLFENDTLSFILFGDVATMLPVIDGEVKTEYFYDDSASDFGDRFSNYGAATGLFGNLFALDYRLEFRYAKGMFRPSFYNSTYDRLKGTYVEDVVNYLADPTIGETTMGIYGSLGMDIAKIFRLNGGYLWPWTADGFNPADDFLHLELVLVPDFIPIWGIHGSISYVRAGLAEDIQAGGFDFIDEGTILKGELIYPVSPTLDLALLITSALSRDDDGNLIDPANAYYTFTIDTRVHF